MTHSFSVKRKRFSHFCAGTFKLIQHRKQLVPTGLIAAFFTFITFVTFVTFVTFITFVTFVGSGSQLLAQGLDFPSDQSANEEHQMAVWVLQDPVDKLVIGLDGILSKKQKSLLNSGFSTFSQLTIGYVGDSEQPIELYRVACTVKFDTWDEVYELARLDERPQTAVVDSFKDYVNLCLSAEIVSQATLAKMSGAGGELIAKIQIEQISPKQASKLKDWLVEQQTGVMQGLFSHMLNELTLSETLEFAVKVPSKPKKSQAQINGGHVKTPEGFRSTKNQKNMNGSNTSESKTADQTTSQPRKPEPSPSLHKKGS